MTELCAAVCAEVFGAQEAVSQMEALLLGGIDAGVCLLGIASSGKSMLARSFARHSERPVAFVECEALLDTGDVDAADALFMRALLSVAGSGRGVIVLDALDVVLPQQLSDDDSLFERRLRDVLLQRVRQLLAVRDVPPFLIVTARSTATLAAHAAALLPRTITLGALSQPARVAMLRALLPAPGVPDDALVALARDRLAGFTGGDVRRLVLDARLSAPAGVAVTEAMLRASDVRPASLSAAHEQSGRTTPLTLDTDVAGLPKQKAALLAAVRGCVGAVVVGPPGAGKTLLALAVCGSAGLPVLSVRGVDIVSAIVGQSEKALADVFDRARSAVPCVMLLDQLETLAPPRGPRLTATQSRLLSCLVGELDRCPRGPGGVAVVATVGALSLCDDSIFGAGRLECVVELPGPDARHGLDVLRHRVARLRVAGDVTGSFLASLAEQCCSTRSAASICACCDEAAMVALREAIETPAVAQRHLESAFGVHSSTHSSESLK